MDTTRDLLFSLVAFQKGVIDADRLDETCAAWNGEAAIPLADRLVDRGWLMVEQKTELEYVLTEELKAHGGDVEATLAANVDGRCLEALGKVPQIESAVKAQRNSARAGRTCADRNARLRGKRQSRAVHALSPVCQGRDGPGLAGS